MTLLMAGSLSYSAMAVSENTKAQHIASLALEATAGAQVEPVSIEDFMSNMPGDALAQGVDRASYFNVQMNALNIKAETDCMAKAVYYEARSETRAGQKAVAEVILNRVKSKHYPSTVCDVVYEGSERRTGCQFSFTCDGSMDKAPNAKAWNRSYAVAELAMAGGIKPMTNRATHYHTTDVSPVWSQTMRMTKRVGSHVFYRFAPRDYTPSTPTMVIAPPS